MAWQRRINQAWQQLAGMAKNIKRRA